MKELWAKIREALVSALPITLIVYLVSLIPGFSFNRSELISFTIGAILLVLGIGLFNLGADIAMTPMGIHVGAGYRFFIARIRCCRFSAGNRGSRN